MPRLKENCCELVFLCKEPVRTDCVYFTREEGHNDCKYMELGWCDSKVAQVNKMTILLNKELQ